MFSGLADEGKAGFCDDIGLRDVEHRAFGDGDDGVVGGEALLELRDGGLEVVLAVGEAAAADHQVAEVREVGLADVLVAVADFAHGHGGQGHGAVQQGLQRGGHAVAVQREAEQEEVAFEDLLQDGLHVVVVDAGAAVDLAGEAAGAVFDVAVDDVDHVDFLGCGILHALQEGTGDVHGVALVPLGTSVENKYLHFIPPFSPE